MYKLNFKIAFNNRISTLSGFLLICRIVVRKKRKDWTNKLLPLNKEYEFPFMHQGVYYVNDNLSKGKGGIRDLGKENKHRKQ